MFIKLNNYNYNMMTLINFNNYNKINNCLCLLFFSLLLFLKLNSVKIKLIIVNVYSLLIFIKINYDDN